MAGSDQVKKIVAGKLRAGKKLRKPPVIQHPDSVIRGYTHDLNEMLAFARKTIEHHVVPKLQRLLAQAENDRPAGFRQDAWPDDLGGAFQDAEDEFYRRYNEEEIRRMARKYGMSVEGFNQKQIEKNFRRVLGVDVFASEPWLESEIRAFAVRNVGLVNSVPDKLFTELESGIFDMFASGTRFEDLGKFISERFGVAESKASFLARDQISKLNGQLNGLRQTNVGVTKYIWETSKDERVRDSHAAKQGKEYSWNDPPSDTGHPGEDYGCRCFGAPVFESVVEGSTEFTSGVGREEE